MPRPKRPWFRFYVEALADRKLRRFTPAQRWLWVAILGAARQSPESGVLLLGESQIDDADLADIAGMAVKEVRAAMPKFEAAQMIERRCDGAWFVPKFNSRQFESDDTTLRTAKHRSNGQRRNVPTVTQRKPKERPQRTETDKSPTDSGGADEKPGRRAARTHWEAVTPKPVLTGGFPALMKLCERFIEAGHSEAEVVDALARTRSYTNDAVTFALRQAAEQAPPRAVSESGRIRE